MVEADPGREGAAGHHVLARWALPFTANNLDNTVTVIDTANNLVIAEISAGKAPTSISVLPNGRQAYVTEENERHDRNPEPCEVRQCGNKARRRSWPAPALSRKSASERRKRHSSSLQRMKGQG